MTLTTKHERYLAQIQRKSKKMASSWGTKSELSKKILRHTFRYNQYIQKPLYINKEEEHFGDVLMIKCQEPWMAIATQNGYILILKKNEGDFQLFSILGMPRLQLTESQDYLEQYSNITDMMIHPDLDQLLVGYKDGKINVFDLNSSNPMIDISNPHAVYCLTYSRTGTGFVMVDTAGILNVFDDTSNLRIKHKVNLFTVLNIRPESLDFFDMINESHFLTLCGERMCLGMLDEDTLHPILNIHVSKKASIFRQMEFVYHPNHSSLNDQGEFFICFGDEVISLKPKENKTFRIQYRLHLLQNHTGIIAGDYTNHNKELVLMVYNFMKKSTSLLFIDIEKMKNIENGVLFNEAIIETIHIQQGVAIHTKQIALDNQCPQCFVVRENYAVIEYRQMTPMENLQYRLDNDEIGEARQVITDIMKDPSTPLLAKKRVLDIYTKRMVDTMNNKDSPSNYSSTMQDLIHLNLQGKNNEIQMKALYRLLHAKKLDQLYILSIVDFIKSEIRKKPSKFISEHRTLKITDAFIHSLAILEQLIRYVCTLSSVECNTILLRIPLSNFSWDDVSHLAVKYLSTSIQRIPSYVHLLYAIQRDMENIFHILKTQYEAIPSINDAKVVKEEIQKMAIFALSAKHFQQHNQRQKHFSVLFQMGTSYIKMVFENLEFVNVLLSFMVETFHASEEKESKNLTDFIQMLSTVIVQPTTFDHTPTKNNTCIDYHHLQYFIAQCITHRIFDDQVLKDHELNNIILGLLHWQSDVLERDIIQRCTVRVIELVSPRLQDRYSTWQSLSQSLGLNTMMVFFMKTLDFNIEHLNMLIEPSIVFGKPVKQIRKEVDMLLEHPKDTQKIADRFIELLTPIFDDDTTFFSQNAQWSMQNAILNSKNKILSTTSSISLLSFSEQYFTALFEKVLTDSSGKELGVDKLEGALFEQLKYTLSTLAIDIYLKTLIRLHMHFGHDTEAYVQLICKYLPLFLQRLDSSRCISLCSNIPSALIVIHYHDQQYESMQKSILSDVQLKKSRIVQQIKPLMVVQEEQILQRIFHQEATDFDLLYYNLLVDNGGLENHPLYEQICLTDVQRHQFESLHMESRFFVPSSNGFKTIDQETHHIRHFHGPKEASLLKHAEMKRMKDAIDFVIKLHAKDQEKDALVVWKGILSYLFSEMYELRLRLGTLYHDSKRDARFSCRTLTQSDEMNFINEEIQFSYQLLQDTEIELENTNPTPKKKKKLLDNISRIKSHITRLRTEKSETHQYTSLSQWYFIRSNNTTNTKKQAVPGGTLCMIMMQELLFQVIGWIIDGLLLYCNIPELTTFIIQENSYDLSLMMKPYLKKMLHHFHLNSLFLEQQNELAAKSLQLLQDDVIESSKHGFVSRYPHFKSFLNFDHNESIDRFYLWGGCGHLLTKDQSSIHLADTDAPQLLYQCQKCKGYQPFPESEVRRSKNQTTKSKTKKPSYFSLGRDVSLLLNLEHHHVKPKYNPSSLIYESSIVKSANQKPTLVLPMRGADHDFLLADFIQ